MFQTILYLQCFGIIPDLSPPICRGVVVAQALIVRPSILAPACDHSSVDHANSFISEY